MPRTDYVGTVSGAKVYKSEVLACVDYTKLKPVLFEMPTYSYLKTGEVIAKCTVLGKEYSNQ